mgnify:CR=1 FL=1
MPPKKEEWEVRFEEYRDTLVSLGAKIKNEKALKLAFKIYGEERMPARIYQNCVEENDAVFSKTESSTPTEAVKKEKTAATDTSRQHPQTAKSKQDSTALKLWLTSGSKRLPPAMSKQPPQQKEAKKRKRARPSANALKNTKAAYRKKALSLTTKTGCGKSSVQSAAGWITDKSANL